jgi:iron complex outermembrane receptor protein
LDEVERIEITKGPAARTYGQNAFSGAINIITKVDGEEKATISLSHGSFNTTSLFASVSNSMLSDKVKQKFSFQKENSNGYGYNRDYDIYNYFYDSKVDFDATSKLRFFAGFTERKFGANGFYALPTAVDQYEEVQTSIASLQYQKIFSSWSFAPRISWRRNFDYYEFVRGKPQIFKNRTLGNRITADLNVTNYNKLGTLGIGIEYSREYLRSISLGIRDRSILSLNVEQKVGVFDNKLNMIPGFFINKFSDQKVQFFPGIDMSFKVNANVKLYGNYNVANRIPTYTDLYYRSSVERGNENIQSESVRGLEFGTNLSHRGVTFNVGAYRNATVGLIDWTKTSTIDSFWVPRNYAATVIEGLEAKLDLDIAKFFSSKDYFTIGIDGSFIKAKSNEESATYITRYQFNHLGKQLIYRISKGFFENKVNINLNYRVIDRVSSDIDKVTGKELLDAKLLDISLSGRLGKTNATFLVNNLTNSTYKELTNVLMPGRWYQFKLSYSIKTN